MCPCYLIQFDLLLLLKPSIAKFQMHLNFHPTGSRIGEMAHTQQYSTD